MVSEAHRRLARPIAAAAVLGAIAWVLPHVRARVLHAVTTFDAAPSEPVALPAGDGHALPAVARTRVILIDGLAADVARTLPAWSATCKRGTALVMDAGFPTVSLPVEAALWSGLTQQQSGIVFRSDRPLEPPLRGIPSRVPGSIAIAEDHGYIVRSLGFAHVEPAADAQTPAKDADADAWVVTWFAHARAAVASDARLVFVHVLRVDTAGHRFGRDSVEYRTIAGSADAFLDALVATAPDARWFLLSDHGHIPSGGHGGEERAVRHVEACIAGPGIAVRGQPAPLVHVVDIARAIADSTATTLDREARGRPLDLAIAQPLAPDQAVPALPLGRCAFAIVVIFVGLLATWWALPSVRRQRGQLVPWWFVLAGITLVILRGVPTLSMPMVWAPTGRAMYLTWLPALAVCAVATWRGLGMAGLARVIVAQLALPAAVLAAATTACGAWPVLAGSEIAPVVPHITAWVSPLVLVVAHGSAAVALAVLGRSVRSAFGRRAPAETPRSEPAAE